MIALLQQHRVNVGAPRGGSKAARRQPLIQFLVPRLVCVLQDEANLYRSQAKINSWNNSKSHLTRQAFCRFSVEKGLGSVNQRQLSRRPLQRKWKTRRLPGKTRVQVE